MKKDYILNIFYTEDEKRNESVDNLALILIKNKDKFEFIDYYKKDDKNHYYFIIQLSEINKNIELFSNNDLSLTLINKLNEGVNESNSCRGCGSVTLNNIPYTYRGYGGCIGKSFECPDCRGLDNNTIHEIMEIKNSKGEKDAIMQVLKIIKQTA